MSSIIIDDANSQPPAPPTKNGSPSHTTVGTNLSIGTNSSSIAKPSSDVLIYASAVQYNETMNPKDINWLNQNIEDKIAPYSPNALVLSNTEVDQASAQEAFTGIFAPVPGETFVWFNQYQFEQTAKKVAGWYGFALSSSAHSIFCPCGKPHTPFPKPIPTTHTTNGAFYGMSLDDGDNEKPKRN